jgi:hypothetical protein
MCVCVNIHHVRANRNDGHIQTFACSKSEKKIRMKPVIILIPQIWYYNKKGKLTIDHDPLLEGVYSDIYSPLIKLNAKDVYLIDMEKVFLRRSGSRVICRTHTLAP